MPLYEFSCDRCGVFEEWRVHREAGTAGLCPGCGRSASRVFSATAIHGAAARRREERIRRAEPRVVTRPATAHPERTVPHNGHGRPWMLGH